MIERPRRKRGPRPIAAAVARLRGDVAPPTLLAKVQECWSQAVGEPVSEQAVPAFERQGIVTVDCRSAVWSHELELLSSTLLEQLNATLPPGTEVRGLKFVTRPS